MHSDRPSGSEGTSPEGLPSGLGEAIYQLMADGVIVLNTDDVIVACNPAMGLLAGREVKDIIGRRPAELWGSAAVLSLTRLTPTTDEVTLRRPDGQTRLATVKSFALPGEGGQMLRVCMYRDITRLRKSELRRREGETSVRLLIESLEYGVLVHANGRVILANQAFARMAGYGGGATLNPEDVPSLFVGGDFDLLHPPGLWEGNAPTASDRVEVTLKTLQGRNLVLLARVSRLEYGGKPAVLCVLRDITARKRSEKLSAATANMARKIITARSERDVGLALLEAADAVFGWDAAFVDLFPTEVDRRLMPHQNYVPLLNFDIVNGERREVPPPRFYMPPETYAQEIADQGPRLILRKPSDLHEPHPYSAFGDVSRPSASLMFVPLQAVSGIIGVVSIQSYRLDAYTESDLEALQALGAQCGPVIEHLRSELILRVLEMAMRMSNDMVAITASDPTTETGTSLIFVNDAFLRETGYKREEVLGRSTRFLQGPETDQSVLKAMHERLVAGQASTFELANYRKDGSKYDVEISTYPVVEPDRGLTCYVSVQRVITGRKREREELAYAALHDPLTQLPNRALFRNRAERAIARAKRYGEPMAIAYLDLDNFKRINDALGHQAGDDVLREVALRLSTAVRPSDTVSRYGGDEFTILLEEISGPKDVKRVAERIMEQIHAQFHVAGRSESLTISMGIAVVTGGGETFDQIVARADEALLAAKAAGKNCYHVSRSRANLPTEGL